MSKMRVWWVPQIGIKKAFYVPVESVEEARKVMDILAYYDCFEYNQNVKPDFCNTGGLEVMNEDGEWETWEYDGDDGYYDEVDEYIEEQSKQAKELEEFRMELANQVYFD